MPTDQNEGAGVAILARVGIDEYHGRYFARATGRCLTFERRTALRIAFALNLRGLVAR